MVKFKKNSVPGKPAAMKMKNGAGKNNKFPKAKSKGKVLKGKHVDALLDLIEAKHTKRVKSQQDKMKSASEENSNFAPLGKTKSVSKGKINSAPRGKVNSAPKGKLQYNTVNSTTEEMRNDENDHTRNGPAGKVMFNLQVIIA